MDFGPLAGTLTHRWWALAFVPVYLWAARGERSWRGALRFYAIACGVSFAAEYASTHAGVPYGRYAYVARVREAHIANVPLFVPLTFGVVVWAGRAVAGRRAHSVLGLVAGGAAAATLLDMAIDPMTVRGSSWFLGPLYRYVHPHGFFGVPWSNFVGWLLVAALIIAVDAALGGGSAARPRNTATSTRGVLLATGTAAFFAAVALANGYATIALVAAAVAVVLAFWGRLRPAARALR
jgi:putative membrane protein